jgi:hypothetical protein
VASVALLAASSALASTVTIGPPVTGVSYTPAEYDNNGTFANTMLQSGSNVTSPVTGTITCWRVTDTTGGPLQLRVLTPDSGTKYTGGASSDPVTSTGLQAHAFSTNLPIKAGQAIGIDDAKSTGSPQFGLNFGVGFHLGWTGSLVKGSTRAADAQQVGEIALNADVQTGSGPPPPCKVGGGGGGGGGQQRRHCVVPKLVGDKLKKAKGLLNGADCRLGKVKGKGKEVKKQRPKAGTVLPVDSKVNVTLGPRHHHRT